MNRILLVVLILVIAILIIPVTYAYTGAEQIELVKNYAMSIGLGGIGAGTVGTIAYGLLKKTKTAVESEVVEAKKQVVIARESADAIQAKLNISDAKNELISKKFDVMSNEFQIANKNMNTLISQYQARDELLAGFLEDIK